MYTDMLCDECGVELTEGYGANKAGIFCSQECSDTFIEALRLGGINVIILRDGEEPDIINPS